MTGGVLVDAVWTVGQVADELGVTVRTLHHYDEIGLLRPSERTPAGYRLYTEDDLERLANVVVYRRLGLPARGDRRPARHAAPTPEAHLRRQREAVMSRLDELGSSSRPSTEHWRKRWKGEAHHRGAEGAVRRRLHRGVRRPRREERWGDTDAWKQSQRRT